MACSITITGRALQCKDALGGIREVYIAPYAGTGGFAAPSAGANSDSAAALQVNQFEKLAGSSSITKTVNA